MKQPPITLVNLTQEEKDRIAAISQKNVVRGIFTFLVPFLLFGGVVVYINLNFEKLNLAEKVSDTAREWLNLGLVLLTILPARFFVNVILRHRKATNAWQKKLIKGKIQAKDGKIITLVNQKVKLNDEQAAKVKVDDDVVVSAMPGGEFVLDVEVIPNTN